jgi:formylglycine-generating enzyme required for sulfatase activity
MGLTHQDFKQTPDDPAVMVSLNDAHAFCAWLTKKEQGEGKLGPNQEYRLPTDVEWSRAVGLNESSAGTPKDKDRKIKNIYPWGTRWPPPAGAGNYRGEETRSKYPDPIAGYNDGHVQTSPVGAFAANRYGLYDMSGNVWQLCEDKWDPSYDFLVSRGGSFIENSSEGLLSSARHVSESFDRTRLTGFRCVLVVSLPKIVVPIAEQPWTNSLGVKFVPAGTNGVLLSVWDVRVKDFRAFVDATGYDAVGDMYSFQDDGETRIQGSTWKSPGFPRGDDCADR